MYRELFLLAASALFISTTSSATTIDYSSGGSGKDVTVSGSPSAGQVWSVTDDLTAIGNSQGSELGTVDISTGKLTACSQGLCFTGGSVDIKSEGGITLFDGTFTTGTVTTSGGTTFLNANLASGGTTEIASKNGVYSSNTIVTVATPEPSGLGLLGAGLLGLAFCVRQTRRAAQAAVGVQKSMKAV